MIYMILIITMMNRIYRKMQLEQAHGSLNTRVVSPAMRRVATGLANRPANRIKRESCTSATIGALLFSVLCAPVQGQAAQGGNGTAKSPALPNATQAAPSPVPVTLASLDAELQTTVKNAPDAAKWPGQDYVTLLDSGDVTAQADGTLIRRYRVIRKLFRESARSQAEISLSYSPLSETMTVLHARTIQADGQVREVAAADVRANNGGSAYPLYEDMRSMSFSLPGIEDNCVIDYEWEVKDRPLLPGQFWRGWRFNGTSPVMRSRFVAHVPADKTVRYQVVKANTITEEAAWKPVISFSADGKTRTYAWEHANIAPLADEPGMPPYYLINTRAIVSSLNSWQAAADWYWKLYQPRAVANDAIRAKANALIAGKSTDEAKARAVYDWVANHVRYVGLEFGVSAYQPHDAAVTFDKLYGDCKDKATLLITMLGVAGIKVCHVLLSANDSRTVHAFLPDLSWFDHCIVAADIGGKNVWLDATSEFLRVWRHSD